MKLHAWRSLSAGCAAVVEHLLSEPPRRMKSERKGPMSGNRPEAAAERMRGPSEDGGAARSAGLRPVRAMRRSRGGPESRCAAARPAPNAHASPVGTSRLQAAQTVPLQRKASNLYQPVDRHAAAHGLADVIALARHADDDSCSVGRRRARMMRAGPRRLIANARRRRRRGRNAASRTPSSVTRYLTISGHTANFDR